MAFVKRYSKINVVYTPKQLEKKWQEYKQYVRKHNVPMTVGRFCHIIECDRDFLNDAAKDNPIFAKQIAGYIQEILAEKEERLLMGKGSTVGHIFDLKNNHGWADKQEIEHKGDAPVQVVFKKEKKENIIEAKTEEKKQIEN